MFDRNGTVQTIVNRSAKHTAAAQAA
jgi:hypothetical protein